MTLREGARDERGLMGKILIVWLLLLALFVVAAIDTGSILYSRFKVADAADEASFDAASTFKTTKDQRAAYQTAMETVESIAPGAKLAGFTIDPRSGDVTVTVVKRAWTLLAGRLGFTKHLAKSSSTQTSGPPTF